MARTGRPTSTFPAVPTFDIGGLSVGKHTLTAQAEQLESITARIGRRLNHWLRTHPDVLPSAEFFEAFRYYQAALVGLLREQRERARLAVEPADMDDAQLQATIRAEFLKAAHTFTPEEWALLDRVRAERSQHSRRHDDGDRSSNGRATYERPAGTAE